MIFIIYVTLSIAKNKLIISLLYLAYTQQIMLHIWTVVMSFTFLVPSLVLTSMIPMPSTCKAFSYPSHILDLYELLIDANNTSFPIIWFDAPVSSNQVSCGLAKSLFSMEMTKCEKLSSSP